MKLDSDSSVVQLPNAKLLQPGNDIVDPTKPKTVKKITKEKQDELLHEIKGSQLIAIPLPSDLNDEDGFWPVADFDSLDPCQDLTNGKDNEIVKVTKGDMLGETELLKEDSSIFTDKNITDYESDSGYNEIKDICVDEGIVSDEKILFETNGDSDLDTVQLPDQEATCSVTKEILEIDGLVSDISKVPEAHCPMDPVGKCCTEHLVFSDENSAAEDLQHNSSADHGDEAEQQSGKILLDESSAESTVTHAAEETMNSYEEVAKDSDTSHVELSLPEICEVECGGNEAISEKNELPYSSQGENGTITFSFAATASTPSNGGHESLFNENKESPDNQDEAKVHEGHAFSGRDQYSLGESSFSVLAGPPSGLISYSGQIAYSGSLSLRSDSSIGTSTRSFAFPVMQSDWNSSPVRMAKSDRRKHKGWRRGLLCCKF